MNTEALFVGLRRSFARSLRVNERGVSTPRAVLVGRKDRHEACLRHLSYRLLFSQKSYRTLGLLLAQTVQQDGQITPGSVQ